MSAAPARHSYGKIPEMLEVGNLIETQLNSFRWFVERGLRELFDEINPITDYTGKNYELRFLDYSFGEPKFDQEECRNRDMTFAAPLRIMTRLHIKTGESAGEIKESEVYLGDFPMMTGEGTFLVNGTERVVVSQLVRSPGVYFTAGAEHPITGRPLYAVKFIPNRGAWLEIETSNKDILTAAGVDPSSITSWATLTAALAKVKAIGDTGITFSGINTEEGSFQFLPWFWGSGANLKKLDSADAISAFSLLAGWVKSGYAPNSVIQNTQTTSWQEFLAKKTAFSENGTWQLAGVKASGMNYGIISIPGKNSGSAPAPTGGEFLTIPVQKNTARYKVTEKIVSCLIGTDNSVATDNTLSYIAPTAAAQAKQVAGNDSLVPWVKAVKDAKGRTSDNLGTKYPKISQQMWTALQASLTGSQTPAAAAAAAQTAAAAATQ